MFRLCGLHTGPDFGIGAATALAGVAPGQAGAGMSVLTDIHLVQETGAGRFRLHDLLRAYAGERASAEEPVPQRRAATLRLVSWYLHTADGAARLLIPQRRALELPGPPEGCRPLAPGDYQAALAWFSQERANLVSAVQQAREDGHHAECWKLAATASSYFMLARHWADWEATSETGLAAARALGDREAEAWMLSVLGVAYWQLGRLDLGVDRQALALFRGDRNTFGVGMALDTLGQIHQARGRPGQALSCFEQSWAARRLAGDRHGEAVALQHLGGARRAAGDLSGAQDAWWRALEIYDALNSPGSAEVRAALAGELARPAQRGRVASSDPAAAR